MRPVGYLYRSIATRPDWLQAPHVDDVYSLSNCISSDFADYVDFWRHNGFWLFDAPAAMHSLAREHGLSLDGLTLFYYEAHELQYDAQRHEWVPYGPEPSRPTDVQSPVSSTLEGFDVATFSLGTRPECSPLSCNGLAAELPTNRHCLFPTFDAAMEALESGRFQGAEPGPYRIIAVHSVDGAHGTS